MSTFNGEHTTMLTYIGKNYSIGIYFVPRKALPFEHGEVYVRSYVRSLLTLYKRPMLGLF